MNKLYYVESSKLDIFFNSLKTDFNVFLPVIKDPNAEEVDYFYKKPADDEPLLFNGYRVVEPLKSFFTNPKESVAEYFEATENPHPDIKKTIIFGVKSCDLAAHKIQDFVFLEGVTPDSLYRLRRENTILISGDCTFFKKVCFCLALNVLPYPTEGFDLNLSPLEDGYLGELGSEKGDELIKRYKEYFVTAKETQISERKTNRDSFIEQLKNHLLPQNLPALNNLQRLVKRGFNLDTWKNFMLTCVECGGCNFICDTCHCFLLADKQQGNQNIRLKLWDSCLYANYARVAGGLNPLRTRMQRLRNRFLKKFDFFWDNLGMPACCGCGRCIEVCPGKIDIREVLKDLAKKLK